jgi:hypothetical protein
MRTQDAGVARKATTCYYPALQQAANRAASGKTGYGVWGIG